MPTAPKKRETPTAVMSRNRSGDPFYSRKPWRQMRAAKLATDPICEECQRRGLVTLATEIDHIVPREQVPGGSTPRPPALT